MPTLSDIEDPILRVHVGPDCGCNVQLTPLPDNEWLVIQHMSLCLLHTPTPVILPVSLMDLMTLSVLKFGKPRRLHPARRY
jgi:hypothetical protein